MYVCIYYESEHVHQHGLHRPPPISSPFPRALNTPRLRPGVYLRPVPTGDQFADGLLRLGRHPPAEGGALRSAGQDLRAAGVSTPGAGDGPRVCRPVRWDAGAGVVWERGPGTLVVNCCLYLSVSGSFLNHLLYFMFSHIVSINLFYILYKQW